MLEVFSCTKVETDPVLIDFIKTIPIHEITVFNNDDIGEVVDMICFDSVVIINSVFKSKIFSIIDCGSGSNINDFINRGKGPNEILFPRLINKYNDSIFSTYEVNKKELIFFNIHEIYRRKYNFYKVLKLENLNLSLFGVIPINDSLLVLLGAFNKGKYGIYNYKTKNVSLDIDFPYDNKQKDVDNYMKGWAHQGEVSLKPDHSEIIFVYKNGYFDICRLERNKLELKKRNLYYQMEYKVFGQGVAYSKKSKYGFRSVNSSSKFIYMIYSGRSQEESGADYFAGNNILVFDWNGNPIVNLKTNRFLQQIIVDENQKLIYGYGINQMTGEPEIVKFIIPELCLL